MNDKEFIQECLQELTYISNSGLIEELEILITALQAESVKREYILQLQALTMEIEKRFNLGG